MLYVGLLWPNHNIVPIPCGSRYRRVQTCDYLTGEFYLFDTHTAPQSWTLTAVKQARGTLATTVLESNIR